MDVKHNIYGIFPTPIYISKLNKFTKQELNYVDKLSLNINKNMGNVSSKNSYVLNDKPFNNIKKQLLNHITKYFDEVISTSDKIVPYITQSWLNYTKENEYHHSHAHPNSFVSGVLYINANKENDKIIFEKNKYQAIDLTKKDFNLYNSDTWFFPVHTGDLIMFPSDTQHKVEYKRGNNIRTSIAFNIYIKGILGDLIKLTELKLLQKGG